MNGQNIYYLDTTGCADVVVYDGAQYRWNGLRYDSLSAIFHGIDYGKALPYGGEA